MQIEGRVKDITARDFWAAKKRIKPYVTSGTMSRFRTT